MDILPQLLVNALISGSIYALASSGLALTYGLLRILNFAHGHLMMAGAYAFYFSKVQMEWGMPESVIFTCMATILLAAMTLEVFIFPFTRFSFFLTLVTTLALSTMLESGVSMLFGVNVKSLTAGLEVQSIEFHGVYITPIQLVIIGSVFVLLFALAFVVHSTSIGRCIRALSENPSAAQGLGVSRKKVSYAVFIVGTLLAAYSGILVGYETNLQPTMGNAYTIKAFAAMILGGLGNIWGTIIGSFILGLVENVSLGLDFPWLCSFFGVDTMQCGIPAGYKDAFAFMIILVVLLVRPQGLFNKQGRTA